MASDPALEYTLYHTDGCHLCELAKALVEAAGVDFNHIDICEQPALAERYGISIPVFAQGERELFWPFDAAQLHDFLGV
ncbi:glutaredoxin 2 [Shewanella denitrificans OS217]|jgi:glutaredoxin|uniref:Glutaredoxin 2 n=1 Tax=Shewanella denitrificans (strain OS217 / ATCC BAA-1090 / DSM 15013) TaxID=318161 RepID=Q12LC7_SHEDO|nr:glutaredoxin family protein [Shewanella denitrificans]ABE55749.1 glutaredoxin 2 [Shewanella denitrificans OS217]